jgi:hypothetical protein
MKLITEINKDAQNFLNAEVKLFFHNNYNYKYSLLTK